MIEKDMFVFKQIRTALAPLWMRKIAIEELRDIIERNGVAYRVSCRSEEEKQKADIDQSVLWVQTAHPQIFNDLWELRTIDNRGFIPLYRVRGE